MSNISNLDKDKCLKDGNPVDCRYCNLSDAAAPDSENVYCYYDIPVLLKDTKRTAEECGAFEYNPVFPKE